MNDDNKKPNMYNNNNNDFDKKIAIVLFYTYSVPAVVKKVR